MLDSGKTVHLTDLIDEFNVNERSIQRDIVALQTAGFRIDSPKKGCYAFEPGFSLKAVNLTEKEASLMVMVAELASTLGKDFAGSFEGIMQKVRAQEYESPYFVKLPHSQEDISRSLQDLFEEAIDEQLKIAFTYEKDGKKREHTVSPLKVANYDGFWYLLAFAAKRDRIIKFAVNRMTAVTMTDIRFVAPEDVLERLEKSTNVWFEGGEPTKVTFTVGADIAPYFKRKIYVPQQAIVKERKDGSLLCEAVATHMMEVVPVVLSFAPSVRLTSPKAWAEEVRKRAGALLGTG
jgi:predicted DNA-binding transcriptional regulator YafY